MTTTDLVRYQTDSGEVALSTQIVKDSFCKPATQAEAEMFIKVCQYQGLNPFLHEAYLLKYKNKKTGEYYPATIVTGEDVFSQRAAKNHNFQGMEAGVIVERTFTVERDKSAYTQHICIPGTIKPPEDKLVGGWAKVYMKGYVVPMEIRVSLEEYDRGTNAWTELKATMIRKVAACQALREACPRELGGLYDISEMPVPSKIIEGRLSQRQKREG